VLNALELLTQKAFVYTHLGTCSCITFPFFLIHRLCDGPEVRVILINSSS
jgi:hypothetical protein